MTQVRFDRTFVEDGIIIPFRREHKGKNNKQRRALKFFTKRANALNHPKKPKRAS